MIMMIMMILMMMVTIMMMMMVSIMMMCLSVCLSRLIITSPLRWVYMVIYGSRSVFFILGWFFKVPGYFFIFSGGFL